MYSNKFRQLRPLACVSPAQMAQPLLPVLRPRPPPKRNFEGVATKYTSGTTKLCPLPPPGRTTEGVAKMREFVLTNINVRDKSRTSSEPQSIRLPSILEPSRGRYQSKFAHGVRATIFEADLFRQWRLNKFLEQEKEKALCTPAKQVSQEKSASSKRDLKGENDWADFKLNLNTCPEAPKAMKKVSEPKIEREEMDLTEPEEFEEGSGNPEEMDCELMDLTEYVMWEKEDFEEEKYENERVIKRRQDKNEKIKQAVDRIREKVLKNENLIEQKKEKLRQQQMKSSKAVDISERKRMYKKLICEKLFEVHKKCFDHFCCPDFVFLMLEDFDDWSLDWSERMPDEMLEKKLEQNLKLCIVSNRLQTQAELEALKEERRQRRRQRALEMALAPPVKISGKKLMPRSPPPKMVIKKEEPVETKNLE